EMVARFAAGAGRLVAAALTLALLVVAAPAGAQPSALIAGRSGLNNKQPITFGADQVDYQREKNLVIAKGHVEAWQNGVVLHADEIEFNRQTGTSVARGHVVLMQPDGQVLFADTADLDRGLRNGVFGEPSALLPQNGRFAAGGARRTGGQVDDLARVVYSTCNLCAKNPSEPPLWQVRARNAVDDEEHQRIEYTDAELQVFGLPVAYLPYFWHASPSAKRQSGLLVPTFGINSHIGAFFAQPYYWVIDDRSDATFTPMITSSAGPEVNLEYRRRFNSGFLDLEASAGYLNRQPQGTVYLHGQFNLNDQWRYGFSINRASSPQYVTDFHLGSLLGGDPNVLASNIYLEGFGEGAYSRLDTKFYQGLNQTIVNSKLPLVFPRYQYSYVGLPDALGGTLSVDTGAFNVLREDGTSTQRAALTVNWDRPFTGALGDLWTIKLHADTAAYDASKFNEQPNFGTHSQVSTAHGNPAAAVDFRWPFMRDSGAWGTQVIEPMAEIIVQPTVGDSQVNKYPNEDSLNIFDFNDSNLFGFRRFGGIDRQESGSRANLALHGAWYIGGTAFDGLIGQSYRTTRDTWLPAVTGLRDQVSDIVGRATFTPTQWLDLTYRWRLDHKTLTERYREAVASVGVPKFRLTGGYIYSNYDPYFYYDQPAPPPANSPFFTPRNEITLGAATSWGRYRLTGYARRDLARGKMDAVGADAIYEDECFAADLRLFRRFTSYNGDNGSTTVLLQLTFKTIGEFGFRAL
ncbi:MAG: LPS assembly protein LptD, partial [Pseudomonadota bacterium]|nr:LPS assembly protein LptD [Pseudomonadota bacterium]